MITAATMILCWEALGFGLSYSKGQLGTSVTWIGGQLAFNPDGICASVKETITEDIVEALDKYQHLNIVSHKEIRSFVGRANHAAGLLVTLRPFLHSIWKALSTAGSGPRNTIWVKQIAHALAWLRLFFKEESPGITRQFSLEEFKGYRHQG